MNIKQQLKTNFIPLVSLLVALTALGLTAWRNETTEYNRNIRFASFTVLQELAELQLIADYAYYEKDSHR